MNLLKEINLLVEEDKAAEPDAGAAPVKDANPVDKTEPSAEPETPEPEEDEDEEGGDEEDEEDVGSVVASQGFEKESKEMFAFGETRQVTVLTKTEQLGGLEVTYQYVINPKTGSWTLSACLAGQSAEDMIEFHKGEDSTSLIASLKQPEKITAQQAVDNLNPPADPKAE